MLNPYPAKFDGHKHCDSTDAKLLVVEERDFTCLFKFVITVYG